jgi:putative transposase
MPNHLHLIAVPQNETGLARTIGEAHRRYTRRINFREKWRGHLWQERFASFPMDELHLLATVRYVDMISNWEDFLRLSTAEELKVQKLHERTGRPLGSDRFLEKMEVTLGRVLRPQKPGPTKKNKS